MEREGGSFALKYKGTVPLFSFQLTLQFVSNIFKFTIISIFMTVFVFS